MGTAEGKSIIQLGKTGIVYENSSDFDNSIFNRVYDNAAKLTEQSVNNQIANRHRKSSHEQADNIITFVGRRGTGKTSAMLSFMECLKNNDRKIEGDKSYKICSAANGKPVRFITLEWIDASLLEKEEDIFEFILAKMLNEFLGKDEKAQYLEKSNYEYAIRELYKRFGDIYKKMLNLKKKEEGHYGSDESAISLLRDLARSSDLRYDFEELIKEYIRVQPILEKREYTSSSEETFLVVAIDDVDMNVNSGFDILERIQRYLKVNGLIVLMAINNEQMQICCEKHFIQIYGSASQYTEENKRGYISKISEEYMEKVLPSYMRVYLPSLKKKDYDRNQVTKVRDSLDGKEQTIKEAMFRIIERRTRVRYDCRGRKRHFMEPDTLRALNNQYINYKSLHELEAENNSEGQKQKKEFLKKLDWNLKESMDDILFRFSYENLLPPNRNFFISLSEEDIIRRGICIVERFWNNLSLKEIEKTNFIYGKAEIEEFFEDFEIYGYSYGELMRCIFFLGRQSKADKKLVHAILAMYSVALTRIFYCYKDETDADKRKKKYDVLVGVFTESVGGSWSKYMLPKMGGKYVGASKGSRLDAVGLQIDDDLADRLMTVQNGDSPEMASDMAGIMEGLSSQFIMMLFLSGFSNEDPNADMYTLDIKKKPNFEGSGKEKAVVEESSKQSEIGFIKCRADYNILNFINNIFNFKAVLRSFIKALFRAVKREDWNEEHISKLVDETVEKLKELKSEEGTKGFFCKVFEWHQKTGGMAVPAYSTDIYYNMLKRLVRELKLHPRANIEMDQLLDELRKVIKQINDVMASSDSYYRRKKEVDKKQFSEDYFGSYIEDYDKNETTVEMGEFQEALLTCPVVQRLIDTTAENQSLKLLYNDFVSKLIEAGDEQAEKRNHKKLMASFLD